MKDHLVELRMRTQVYADPLLARRGAHPRAGEELRGLQVHHSVGIGELHFVEGPLESTLHPQTDAVGSISRRVGKVERFLQPTHRHGNGTSLLVGIVHLYSTGTSLAGQSGPLVHGQNRPSSTIVRGFPRHFVTTLSRLIIVNQSTSHDRTTDGLVIIVHTEQKEGLLATHGVTRIRTSVYHPFPFSLRHTAFGGLEVEILGSAVGHDAVSQQLRCQVIVIGRGLVRGTQEGQIAVLVFIRQELRRKVFLGTTRIDADASGIVVGT